MSLIRLYSAITFLVGIKDHNTQFIPRAQLILRVKGFDKTYVYSKREKYIYILSNKYIFNSIIA